MGFIATYFEYIVSGDTHAAVQNEADNNLGFCTPDTALAVSGNNALQACSTVETTLATYTTTVPATPNIVYLAAAGIFQKKTNTGTYTFRIKRGSTTLYSFTSGSMVANQAEMITDPNSFPNETAGSTTYNLTFQTSTASGAVSAALFVYSVNATLSGSSGTCRIA